MARGPIDHHGGLSGWDPSGTVESSEIISDYLRDNWKATGPHHHSKLERFDKGSQKSAMGGTYKFVRVPSRSTGTRATASAPRDGKSMEEF